MTGRKHSLFNVKPAEKRIKNRACLCLEGLQAFFLLVLCIFLFFKFFVIKYFNRKKTKTTSVLKRITTITLDVFVLSLTVC